MPVQVGFILPSSEYLFDPFRGDPFTHFSILTRLQDVFGPKIHAKLIDLRGIKKGFAIYHIPQCDIYLHSVYTLDYEEQSEIVKCLRALYPKAIHIAGGPHIYDFLEECSTIFDTLILGDGEETIIQIIEDVERCNLQKTYRCAKAVQVNDYPHWRRDFLPPSATARKNMLTLKNRQGFENLVGTTTILSRGCPYNCKFCAMPSLKEGVPGIRFLNPARVEEEIEYLKRNYGIQGLALMDEICLPPKNEDAIKHLETIGRTGMVWRGQCRVDSVRPHAAKLLHESGCLAMGLGIESVHQPSLDIINKRISLEKARETIYLLKQNGIEVRLYIIFGLPAEPEDIVDRTWSFIQETEPDLVFLSLLTVRPGTEMFRHPEKFGMKNITRDWKKTMHLVNRYSEEEPQLTFEYEEKTPWGKGMTEQAIVRNFLELQRRLKETSLNALPPTPKKQ